jgi:hypothetical protein
MDNQSTKMGQGLKHVGMHYSFSHEDVEGRDQGSDWDRGVTVRYSNPGGGKCIFFSETYRRSLGSTQPPVRWVLRGENGGP